MKRVLVWLAPVLGLAGLLAAATVGLPYVADYGHHNYTCFAQLLPCVVSSKADSPAGIAAVWLSLALVGGFTVVSVFQVLQPRAHFVYILLGVAAVYWLGFIVLAGGFFVGAYQISALCLMIACLVAVITQFGAGRLRLKPALIVAGSSTAVWTLSLFATASLAPCMPFLFPLCFPNLTPRSPDAQESLLYAVPTAYDSSGAFIGYDHFTADELNRIHQGSKLRPLHFVDADTPSTYLDVVSVNPIDRDTWAAVALSSSGRCYAILIGGRYRVRLFGAVDHYGMLPTGSPCIAAAATPATVTGTHWPPS